MSDFFAYVLVFTGVFWVGYWWRGHLYKTDSPPAQVRQKYTWACPTEGCTFTVSTNDKSVTDHIATGHMKYELSK